jgi:hypothetical protein
MDKLLPHGEWVAAMRSLLMRGYGFARVGNSFKLRMLASGEETQDVLLLLAGVELANEQTSVSSTSMRTERQTILSLDEELGSEGGEDRGDKEDLSGGLVLSVPAENLTLSPASYATTTGIILAKKHSGKTYLGMVLAEEMLSCSTMKVPLVILDPMGVWGGLCSMEDGSPSPYHILRFGGVYANLPITSKDGAKVAEVVNAIRPHAVQVDMSLLAPVEQHEFVADFSSHLYATSPKSPLHVFIDEADEFAPERLSAASSHQKRSLENLDRLVRRGRGKGIGTTIITQRPAVINKNIRSQFECMWLLNMVDPRDLLAVEELLRRLVTAPQLKECIDCIPALLPGHSYFVQGGFSPKFRKFKVRKKRTLDSSKTPDGMPKVPLLSQPLSEALATAQSVFSKSPAGEPS